MIGTTRRYNEATGVIEWTRKPSQGAKQPPADAKDSIIYRVHAEKEAGRHIFQVGTSDPLLAVAAARLVAGDVAGIDVNAGCPKPFSTHDGMGAALLRTPDRLCAILEALVREVARDFKIAISVKIRLLETPAATEALVRRLVATGIAGLTVHCRTTPMRPRERAIRAQLRMIADICRDAGVACVMNGDVTDRDQAAALIREYGVDGAMIATAAEKNPSCFRSSAGADAGGEGGLEPWERVVERYVRCALEVENRYANTKHMISQLVPGKSPFYRAVMPCKSYERLCAALGLDQFVDRAREVDAVLGLETDGPVKQKKPGKRQPNQSALAAGGQMAESRSSATSQSRRDLSSRGVSSPSSTETRPVEEAPAPAPAAVAGGPAAISA